MESREEKLNQMKQEYQNHHMSEEQVNEMKKKIEQAKQENRKERKRHVWRKVAAVAAGVAIILTILPNTSVKVAYAMSRVPFLSKWIEVVTFRDYQYDDSYHTADITVPELSVAAEVSGETETVDKDVQEQTQKTTDEINAEIKSITDKLIAEFEENRKNEEGYQNMTVKSEVIATTDQYFTLKLMCYQAAGSGAEWDYYYTIDLATGQRLSLSDLFKEGSSYISVISENIKSQMKEQMAADENVTYWLDSDMPEWDFTEITDETGFYLNDKGEVVISFNEGDVAPMYMGCVEFVIPDEVLAEIRK